MDREINIRPYRPQDAMDLYHAVRASLGEVSPWLPWCHEAYSLQDASEWAIAQAREFEQGREFAFVIEDGTGRFLGGCGLNHINFMDRVANLGYWVRTEETGRGVALQAVRRLVAFAFSKTDLERLEIVCAMENRASRRVAEKVGAVMEGVARGRIFLNGMPQEAVVYSILRSDEWAEY